MAVVEVVLVVVAAGVVGVPLMCWETSLCGMFTTSPGTSVRTLFMILKDYEVGRAQTILSNKLVLETSERRIIH